MTDFVGPRPPVAQNLRHLLSRPEPLLAPGVYDGLTARLVQQAGFEAAYMTGFGVSASLLGRPDIGLLTATEMAGSAGRIAEAIELPLIADADTGYGNALNVVRTVRDYERAGVAAVQLEDQISPKRCGHMSGKEVIDTDEAVAKIKAAASARSDPDLVLVARTDAAAVYGIDAAIERGHRFADAGADVLFIEAPRTIADIDKVATGLAEHTLLFNWVEGGQTEGVTLQRLAEFGFRLIIYPISTLLATTRAVPGVLRELRAEGTTEAHADRMDDFDGFLNTIGLPEIRDIEQRFRS